MSMQRLAIALGLAMLAATPAPVYPQQKSAPASQAYPTRPIRLIIPYSPGGASDNIARLVMPRLGEALGQTIVHVPYKSIAPAVTDLIGGQIPIAFPGTATVGGHIRAGRVRLLAVAARQRSPAFPDAPTFEEAGVPGMVAANWYGIMGPARLPRPIVDRLNAELHKVVRMREVQERFAASGIETLLNTPEEFRTMLESETARWGKVVKAAGIKPE